MIRAFIHGNVGGDCEVKTSPKGATYLTFSVASTEGEVTTWINCIIFDSKMIEFNRDKLLKGARVELYGRLKIQTNDKGTYHNLTVADVISAYSKQGSNSAPTTAKVRAGVKAPARGDADESDDEAPFLNSTVLFNA